ncbi:MAG: CheY-like chemotaxis protein [Cellvibrionaceae bacterium]|jgi:CheY-like chemotaxis protein
MNGKPITILLVDDDPAHAEIVRCNLDDGQIANQLNCAADGQAALDYSHRVGPYQDPINSPTLGLVLLDLRLPKVDGLEVLKDMKTVPSPSLSKIPVAVMTTSAAESDVTRAYENRVNSYVVKPLDVEKFTALLDVIGYYWVVWNEHRRAKEMEG